MLPELKLSRSRILKKTMFSFQRMCLFLPVKNTVLFRFEITTRRQVRLDYLFMRFAIKVNILIKQA